MSACQPVIPVKVRTARQAADQFNRAWPSGTPVTYWPGVREGKGRQGRTRSAARVIGDSPCVWVTGYPGGIALTHIEVMRERTNPGD